VLKRENRIRSKKEFLEAKNKGKILYSPLFGFLSYEKKDDLKKFGFVISKKISKKAVERNRIKRVLSEIVRKNLNNFKNGTRVVFLTKQAILGKKMEEVEKEVLKLIK
jgi:ribonuclease P protein component